MSFRVCSQNAMEKNKPYFLSTPLILLKLMGNRYTFKGVGGGLGERGRASSFNIVFGSNLEGVFSKRREFAPHGNNISFPFRVDPFSEGTLYTEGQLSVSGKRMCTILVNRLEN